jgi:PhnB protein
MAIGETHFMLRDATTPDLAEYRRKGFAATPHSLGGSPVPLYIYVKDVDAAFGRALTKGWKLVDPLGDKPWGDRCGGVQDPSGHVWFIATPIRSAKDE